MKSEPDWKDAMRSVRSEFYDTELVDGQQETSFFVRPLGEKMESAGVVKTMFHTNCQRARRLFPYIIKRYNGRVEMEYSPMTFSVDEVTIEDGEGKPLPRGWCLQFFWNGKVFSILGYPTTGWTARSIKPSEVIVLKSEDVFEFSLAWTEAPKKPILVRVGLKGTLLSVL